MQVTTDNRTNVGNEVRLIPVWAMVLAAIGFVCMQFVFNVIVAQDRHAPPAWGRVLMGFAAGIVLGAYFLLVGYINRDAGRRGMSRVLWTTIAVLVPNALGIILYFLLRQPLLARCLQCGTTVESGYNYCPRCSTKLHPGCPNCQREIRPGNDYCPYCGGSLKEIKQAIPG